MRRVKRIVKWLNIAIWMAVVVAFIGFTFGLTPLPRPPKGVRIEPLRRPLAMADVTTDNAAHYYLAATAIASSVVKETDEFKRQTEAILSGDWSEGTDSVEQTIAECSTALELVRIGTGMRKCQMPWLDILQRDETGTKSLRYLAKLMCCAGKLLEREGKYDEAIGQYETVIKFGSDCANDGPILSMLVGWGVASYGNKSLRAVVWNHAVSNACVSNAAASVEGAIRRWPPLSESLRYELIDTRRRFGSPSTNTTWYVRLLDWRTDQMMAAAFGEFIHRADKPYWRCDTKSLVAKWAPDRFSRWWILDRPQARLITSMSVGGLERDPELFARAYLDLLVTKLVCKIKSYQQTHASPPERLDELVPSLLPAVPTDPFDDRPLRYRRTGDGWIIWSVGSDLKDDNAAWHEFKYRKPGEKSAGGDIFFKSTEAQDDLAFYQKRKTSRQGS
jgi:hypothetical protein